MHDPPNCARTAEFAPYATVTASPHFRARFARAGPRVLGRPTDGSRQHRRFLSEKPQDYQRAESSQYRLSTRERDIPPCTPSGRSEEHTSELQSRENLVCRLLLEKKNINDTIIVSVIIGLSFLVPMVLQS